MRLWHCILIAAAMVMVPVYLMASLWLVGRIACSLAPEVFRGCA
jgi:hypothetical protein